MDTKLFGVPVFVWGGLCLLLTILWIFVWPNNRVAPADRLRYIVLRWFHALVWLILAVAAFIAGFDLFGGQSTAKPTALLSLIVYLIFMFTLLTSKGAKQN